MEDKQVTMIRGLFRAAERLEQDPRYAPGGKIWDDATRVGLELAREYGWDKGQAGTLPQPPRSAFQDELQSLINRHSQENGSNTPDYILASYLRSCLDTFNLHTKERDRWYGNRSLLGPGAANESHPPVPTSERSLLR